MGAILFKAKNCQPKSGKDETQMTDLGWKKTNYLQFFYYCIVILMSWDVFKIYDAIAVNGFTESTLKIINELITDIENGTTDFSRFNQQEHSGLC